MSKYQKLENKKRNFDKKKEKRNERNEKMYKDVIICEKCLVGAKDGFDDQLNYEMCDICKKRDPKMRKVRIKNSFKVAKEEKRKRKEEKKVKKGKKELRKNLFGKFSNFIF